MGADAEILVINEAILLIANVSDYTYVILFLEQILCMYYPVVKKT